MNTLFKKKFMAFAGILWFGYILFHISSLQFFFIGKNTFNTFFQLLENSYFYHLLKFSLIFLLFFHIFIAISRQLSNNKKREITYKKPYPKAIPRVLAWTGAIFLLSFIIFHFVQMNFFITENFYQEIIHIFTNPLMILIYIIGIFALSAHIHHALGNILQTLGVSSKPYHVLVILIALFVFVSFIAVLLGAIYA